MKFNKNRWSVKENKGIYVQIFFCNASILSKLYTVEEINRLMHSEQDNTKQSLYNPLHDFKLTDQTRSLRGAAFIIMQQFNNENRQRISINFKL